MKSGLVQQQPGGEVRGGKRGILVRFERVRIAAAPREFLLAVDESSPQQGNAGIRLAPVIEYIRGLGWRAPTQVTPGFQRLDAALLIKATLRQSQAQRRVRSPLRLAVYAFGDAM